MIRFSSFELSQTQEIVELFTAVFTQSESEQEGLLIGRLVSNLIKDTAQTELLGFVAHKEENIVGSIFFSRLTINSKRQAFILSPVAIATNHQHQKIGQNLIQFGIEYLKSNGVDWLITYGDPNFYTKVGFAPISEALIQAPFTLSHPQGWLGQSLSANVLEQVNGKSQCVSALNDPIYW